ncbi:hypothetical protein Tsubulata_050807 [Turnera subulata]|uniref:Cystatin domain-containing protein n=1 Tax=Turnera subulata TaxID=218843 RepID=A0A9Q0JKB2_9ROSI|nr:hypothetical protein Tsubulata_050807 [Turnera subulata]
MASHFLLLCSLFLLAATAAYGGRLGDWQPISSRDPHIREIGEFAVRAYHATLKLESVLKAERQVVSGYNYRLVLTVKDGGEGDAPKKYVAVVKTNSYDHHAISSTATTTNQATTQPTTNRGGARGTVRLPQFLDLMTKHMKGSRSSGRSRSTPPIHHNSSMSVLVTNAPASSAPRCSLLASSHSMFVAEGDINNGKLLAKLFDVVAFFPRDAPGFYPSPSSWI